MRLHQGLPLRFQGPLTTRPARGRPRSPKLVPELLESRFTPGVGDLDLDFDTDGIRFDDFASGNADALNAVAIDPAGGIVAVGYANDGTQDDFLVVRYTPDGQPDSSFGPGGTGTVIVDVSNIAFGSVNRDDKANAVAIQTDGAIVVAGSANDGIQDDFAFVRLDKSGNLDTSFNGTGIKTVDASGIANFDGAAGLALQPDGKILAAGFANMGGGKIDTALVRLDPVGGLDTSFNGTGLQVFDASGASKFDEARAVAIQPDGKIVVAGVTQQPGSFDFFVARGDSGGAPDPTFNGTGIKNIDVSAGGFDQPEALAIQPDGKILAAGFATIGGQQDMAVVRLDTTGALDGTFNTTGIKTIDVSGAGKADEAFGLGVQADGKIVLAGFENSLAGDGQFAVVRVDNTGALDTSFAGTGIVKVNVTPGMPDEARAMTFQPDDPNGRLIVAAGFRQSGGSHDSALVRLISRDPATPAFTGILDDTGAKSDDQITKDQTLFLLGTADPFTSVTVTRVGVGAIGTVKADVVGDWKLDYTGTTLPDGEHKFTAVAKDSTGVTSASTPPFLVTVDTSVPTVTVSRVGVSGANGQVINLGFTAAGMFDVPGTTSAPIPGFTADVRSTIADVNGDGKLDVVAVRGPGGPSTLTVQGDGIDVTVNDVFNDPGFTGGLFVGAADLDGDGKAEIFVTPDVGGGGRVTGFRYDGTNLVQLTNFIAINDANFRGGARVALGDINGDGTPDLIVGAGFGGGPRVSVFDGQQVLAAAAKGASIPGIDGGEMLKFPSVPDFFAFTGTDVVNLRNGVFLNSGDFDGDSKSDFAFGGGPGGAPRVFIISGAQVFAGDVAGAQSNPIANFFDGNDSTSRGGVRVAAKDADGDALADLVTGSGENQPALVRDYLGKNLPGGSADPTVDDTFAPFGGSTLANGVFVG